MFTSEQIDQVVTDSFIGIHLEGAEWTFKDDVKKRAQERVAAEGLLGETIEYRLGSYLLNLIGREPGSFLQKRRYVMLSAEQLVYSLTRLKDAKKIEQRNEPRDNLNGRRIQYSLTYLHPLYGSPEHRRLES